jgi:MFS family permease
VFTAALALFSLASLLSGLAWSQGSLITFRALQGLGGAMLSPVALALLMTTFTQHRERNIALGVWDAGMTGVQATDAGIASGLLTTGQQIGGAIGLAAATTISITFTGRYLHSHPGTSPLSGAALTHGFQIAFYVLAALVVLAAVTAAAILASKPSYPVDEVDRASRMAPERLRHGGSAADLVPERST